MTITAVTVKKDKFIAALVLAVQAAIDDDDMQPLGAPFQDGEGYYNWAMIAGVPAGTLTELELVSDITASAAELNLNDGAVAGTAVASKTLALGANKEVDVLAIADLKLGAGAGTSMTATAVELNKLASVTAGTASASKALVLGASKNVDTISSPSFRQTGQAVTATVGGGTTGLIPAGASFCTVTSDNADKSISLPAGTVGDVLRFLITGAACELIAVTALDKVNDVVVGTTNELALTQDALYRAEYVAANKWIVTGVTKLGAAIAALVPDALA
jgi:hypothetical protein